LSFTPAGGGGWTKFVRGALDAAETVGDLIEVSKSVLKLASGEGDLDDLVTLGITGAGLGLGGLPPGKKVDPNNVTPSPALPDNPWNPNAVDNRIRPTYRPNPAHDERSPLYNPRKTPEPPNAAEVYENAVRSDMKTWYGVSEDGRIYRYFSDNAGGVHFSGEVSKSLVPNHIKKQLGIKGKGK